MSLLRSYMNLKKEEFKFMNLEPQVMLKTTGVILTLSVLAPIVGLIIISRGDLGGLQASIRGIQGVGESADILRKSFPLAPLTIVLTLAGFGLLTIVLRGGDDNGISILGFILVLFSQIFIVFQGTFHSSVTVWAAKELANTGSVPELFEPLWRWMYSTVQQVYVYTGLLAIAAFGWAVIQTKVLPGWLGWGAIGWGVVWLILFMVVGDNLPLVLFVPPLVIGIVALVL